MGSLADNLRQISGPPSYPVLTMMPVLGVGDDGQTVVLDAGNGKPVIVPCVRSYADRSVGDQALVLQLSLKSWIVLGAPGSEQSGLQVSDIQAMINDSLNPPGSSTSFGTGPPTGSGWQQATVLPWVRDDGAGGSSTYYQIGTAATRSTAPAKVPSPVTVVPSDHGSYRPSGQTDSGIIQGAWTGQNWTGVMFYGSALHDRTAGHTVSSMYVTLGRLNDSSGWNRGVEVYVGTHGKQSKGKVTSLNNVHALGTLQHGESKTWKLPTAIVNAVKSGGGDFGLGVGGTSAYVKFTSGSGAVKINFSA